MAVIATDNFNRANADPIGGNWTTVSAEGDMAIVSNAATPHSSVVDSGAFYNAATFPNDQYAQANCAITGTVAATGPGVSVRAASGAETYYRVVVSHAATLNVELDRVVTGTLTALWQRTATFNNGDLIRLEVQGSVLRVFIAGVQVGADFTDGSPITSGAAGMAYAPDGAASAITIDNWEAGDFTTAMHDPIAAPYDLLTQMVTADQSRQAAAGGTAWTAGTTDDTGLTDTVVFEQDKVVTDSAGLTDTVAIEQDKVVTDSAGLTDTFALTQSKVVTDSAGLTDTAAIEQDKVITDSAGLTDTTALEQDKVVTDSAGLTDTFTTQVLKLVAPTDDTGLTDTTAFNRTVVISDDTGLTDAAVVTGPPTGPPPSATLALSDQPAAKLSALSQGGQITMLTTDSGARLAGVDAPAADMAEKDQAQTRMTTGGTG